MSERIISYDPDAYFKHAVLQTPTNQYRQVRIVLDSRERNVSLFPNPNNYEVNLTQDIQNVSNIRLVSTTFPFSSYLVNNTNNVLQLAYNNTVVPVTVDTGMYDESGLAQELQTAINSAVGASNFQVTYNARKDNFTFACTASFGLVFRGQQFIHPMNNSIDTAYAAGSMGKLLGFGIDNYMSVGGNPGSYPNIISSEFRKDFSGVNSIVLTADLLEINVSTSDTLLNSFAIVTRTNISDTTQYDVSTVVHKFTPPISRLAKLKLRLTDYYGNPYDFQNQDHRLEFVVTCEGR